MTERFKVDVYKNNSVKLIDTLDTLLMCIKFNNKEDAVSCQNALSHQCNLMNALYDENKELKKEVKQLKNKINTYHKGNKTLHKTLEQHYKKK